MNCCSSVIQDKIETICDEKFSSLLDYKDEKGFMFYFDININYLDIVLKLLIDNGYTLNKKFTLYNSFET